MPERLNFTLVADGPSDRALIPILEWALGQRLGATLIEGEYADLGELLPQPPKRLSLRIAKSVELYPCELLFVHRDAERESFDRRQHEIQDAIDEIPAETHRPWVGVVPVRMQEAWLLIDAEALQKAADGTGRRPPALPPIKQLEKLPDPKQTLYDLMQQANGARGRKLRKFQQELGRRRQRIAEIIDDFSPLRQLPAFQRLEQDIQHVLKHIVSPAQR